MKRGAPLESPASFVARIQKSSKSSVTKKEEIYQSKASCSSSVL